jgi:hypothetical protein
MKRYFSKVGDQKWGGRQVGHLPLLQMISRSIDKSEHFLELKKLSLGAVSLKPTTNCEVSERAHCTLIDYLEI